MTDDLTTRFQAKWGFARGLTRDLLRFVDASDLAFGPSKGPLWKHFRHLGRVQENYLRGIETGRIRLHAAPRERLPAELGTVGCVVRKPDAFATPSNQRLERAGRQAACRRHALVAAGRSAAR